MTIRSSYPGDRDPDYHSLYSQCRKNLENNL